MACSSQVGKQISMVVKFQFIGLDISIFGLTNYIYCDIHHEPCDCCETVPFCLACDTEGSPSDRQANFCTESEKQKKW